MSLELQIDFIKDDIYLCVCGTMESLESLMVGCNSGLDLVVTGLVNFLTLSCQHIINVRDVSVIVSERQIYDEERVGITEEFPLSFFHGVLDYNLVPRPILLVLVKVLPCVWLLRELELGRERVQEPSRLEPIGDRLIELIPCILHFSL